MAVGLVSEALAFFGRYFFAAAFFVRLLVAGYLPPPSSAFAAIPPRLHRHPAANTTNFQCLSSSMSAVAWSVTEAVERLGRRDPTLEWISLFTKQLKDSELGELVDCLLAHPNVITGLDLVRNQLTDETGVKLARYLAVSTTVITLDLSHNQFGSATYLAMAAALRVNTSLQHLGLNNNLAVDEARIDAAFVLALRLNPSRPDQSALFLYAPSSDYQRLLDLVEQSHPSLQAVLASFC